MVRRDGTKTTDDFLALHQGAVDRGIRIELIGFSIAESVEVPAELIDKECLAESLQAIDSMRIIFGPAENRTVGLRSFIHDMGCRLNVKLAPNVALASKEHQSRKIGSLSND